MNLILYSTDEVPEDWLTWGEWTAESDTVSVRKRECKNKGASATCRGRTTQKRFREVKKEKEPEYVVEG